MPADPQAGPQEKEESRGQHLGELIHTNAERLHQSSGGPLQQNETILNSPPKKVRWTRFIPMENVQLHEAEFVQ
jgi:hypothetical protein